MELLTPDIRIGLRANAAASIAIHGAYDPAPLLKLFNPLGAATWLATELDSDGDTLFGLADLGFGYPELGYFSLSEIAALRLPFGLGIERDIGFSSVVPLSIWADFARQAGSILGAQHLLRPVEAHHRARAEAADNPGDATTPNPDPLPPSDTGGG
ncbi:hypothetical protein GCM10009087_17990 [Sphingomonas oligophenolica]|uniref:DUF2958 domain-containing protein n=1 Tax=Sphingomonas oligophenolica TaxID=301154 RepID=A0ABU9Y3I8_9SPHN